MQTAADSGRVRARELVVKSFGLRRCRKLQHMSEGKERPDGWVEVTMGRVTGLGRWD